MKRTLRLSALTVALVTAVSLVSLVPTAQRNAQAGPLLRALTGGSYNGYAYGPGYNGYSGYGYGPYGYGSVSGDSAPSYGGYGYQEYGSGPYSYGAVGAYSGNYGYRAYSQYNNAIYSPYSNPVYGPYGFGLRNGYNRRY